MLCPDLEQLERYLSGELDARQRAGIDDHLASCPSCTERLSELREHAQALEDIRGAWYGGSTAEAEDDAPRPSIPGYEILRTVHRGGQGIVYAARQESTHRSVAVKLLLLGRYASKRQRRRFEREIDLTATLDHPRIVTVFDSGITDDGRLYLVMRYVDGQSLDEYVAGRAMSVEATLMLFMEIAEAVNYAHQRGVIHRDLKPSNILIDGDGAPHLLDFGLAKHRDAVEEAQRSVQTQAGEFIGTLAYAAPEQVGGDPHAVDVRSDVYSLGVILFEMLTGAYPYPTTGRLAEVARNIAEAEPGRASSIRREVDDELDTIVAKALSKERERRYQSVGDLLRDLERYRSGRPIEAKGDSTWYVLRKTLRRHRVPACAAAAVLIVLILATVVSIGFWRQAVIDRRDAIQAGEELGAALAQVEVEAEKAAAINEFLSGMLGSANPVLQGKDVTVRQVLDEAAGSIDESFDQQPLIEAELRHTIGNTYLALGLFEASEPHVQRAVDIRRDLLGEEHPDTLTSAAALAVLLTHQGRYELAESVSERTLELRRRVLGDEHPDTLISMNNLGLLYARQGRSEQAEQLWSEALEISRRVLGEEDIQTLLSMTNLGGLYTEMGRYEQAEPLLIHALELQRRALGPEHLLTLRGITSLGTLYERRGEYGLAEPLYVEAVEIKTRVLGPEHPETIIASSGLAWLHVKQGRYDEAERRMSRDLELCRRLLGEEHPGTLHVMSNLAVACKGLGRAEESEELNAEVFELRRRVLGEEHPDTLDSMNNLAVAYYEQGRLEEAEPLWEKALEIRHRVLGKEHPDTLDSMYNLALLREKQGRDEEAEALHARTLATRRRVLGQTHPSTVNSLESLATLYQRMGRLADAERELLIGLEQSVTALGADHPRTRAIAERLAELYEAWSRPDEAAKYRALLAEAEARTSGSEAPE
jgi:tetratricopeptide (TPR) repeat protein